MVLHVLYLVSNEGYTTSSGLGLHRAGLTDEAIRLARLLYRFLIEMMGPQVRGALEALHPQPGIAQLEELLAQVRAAGLAAEFVVDGLTEALDRAL